MKIAVRISQVLVAVLFIISGLVKANDPLGLAYKMEEFFELWSAGLQQGRFLHQILSSLHTSSLSLSITIITLEILLGVALLLGWRNKLVVWMIFLLILFFTFLTGYAYLSGKFTNCGCFGDCLPISPLASFIKDIALLLLSALLLVGQRHIKPLLFKLATSLILIFSLVFSLMLQWYVLNYLPVVDCLPFKAGNNIPQLMKPPPGAVSDSFAIRFIYEKNGQQYEFAPEELPSDFTTYTFVDRKQTLVRKGNADAPIKGFSLTGDSRDEMSGNLVDSADAVLAMPQVLLVFALSFDEGWINNISKSLKLATQQNLPVYIVSANREVGMKTFGATGINPVQIFNTDFTIVRTVARTNPTVLYLEKGVIRKKWAENEINELEAFLLTR